MTVHTAFPDIISPTDKARFLTKFKQGSADECWNWESALQDNTCDSYGRFMLNGKSCYAHRVSYEIFKGKIPKGINVLHTCDNRLCVNPQHLWLGTQKENCEDCVKKGRHSKNAPWKGQRLSVDHKVNISKALCENPSTPKLTKEQVKEIRGSSLTGVALAQIYDVDRCTIYRVRKNKTWKE